MGHCKWRPFCHWFIVMAERSLLNRCLRSKNGGATVSPCRRLWRFDLASGHPATPPRSRKSAARWVHALAPDRHASTVSLHL
ncbi:hypothetical protein HPP92_001059 [Vanilla planifolia]|uniref:Secreted protein n=1 Tax=Vanilla planifolia TaxID=51239 RepID=A0A835SCA6_VANPL|nr:hypothetical protein HPP92_001167 [Vanilla planifolia]KAG0500987.1 hypothetical protein HPP92_001059 [Vanilla planifolia]